MHIFAPNYCQRYHTTENVPRKQRSHKTSIYTDRQIVHMSWSALDIQREILDQVDSGISKRFVASRLVEAGPLGGISRKKPLVNLSKRMCRAEFARRYIA